MANTCLNLNTSAMRDAPFSSVRLQDIPRKTLKMYGIIFDDASETEEEDEGALVIDESVQEAPIVMGPERSVPEIKGRAKPTTTTSIPSPEMSNYCKTCNTFALDFETHLSQHCTISGCPAWIPEKVVMSYHMKIHNNHPTKPFSCYWCKKRYRFYSHMTKHLNLCKSYKRRMENGMPLK